MPTAAADDTEFEDRFWSKVALGHPLECWLWKGATTRAGYGSLKRDQRVLYAHRVSYEMWHGPLPASAVVLHTCDTPACVNPTHLIAGTKADNNRDCADKARGNGGPNSRVRRLRPQDVNNILRSYRRNEATQRELAARYDVSQTTVSKIVRGVSWRSEFDSREARRARYAEGKARYKMLVARGRPFGSSVYWRAEEIGVGVARCPREREGQWVFAAGVYEYLQARTASYAESRPGSATPQPTDRN